MKSEEYQEKHRARETHKENTHKPVINTKSKISRTYEKYIEQKQRPRRNTKIKIAGKVEAQVESLSSR